MRQRETPFVSREGLLGGLLQLGAHGLGLGARGALGEQVRLDLGLGAGRTEDDLVVILETELDDVGGRKNLSRRVPGSRLRPPRWS